MLGINQIGGQAIRVQGNSATLPIQSLIKHFHAKVKCSIAEKRGGGLETMQEAAE